jgi:small-conductance mechanosensitive channel
MRFASFDTRDLAKIREGYQRLDHLERMMRIVRPYFLQQLDLAATLIAEQRNRTDVLPNTAGEMRDCLQEREVLAQRGLRALDNLDRLVARWKESLDQERSHLPVITRVRDLFSEASSFTTKFWHFELFAATDTITVDGQTITGRRSVTVGKIALALIILAVGYWLSLLLSRLLEQLAVKRFKIESSQAGLMRRWVQVVLILALVIFSLVSVKIPLTIFAFLGGALAIGFGFGMQNLLKNFVSGIIILFERPFRVGDVLDIDGHSGTVLSIGIRSSVVKFYDGTETLIPNSDLLENNLTNWTYSDHKVRFSLTLGVAYGSDTRRVAKVLSEVAERHGLVQKEPAPQVLFQEFGDSILTFELRYWADVHQHRLAAICGT